MNNEKGAFRPIYSSIWDDAEFQSFDDTEKLVFFHLRTSRFGNFPCIFVCYPEVIARQLRKQARAIGRALEGLSKALWIALDGEVVWVVKGLRNDPIFTPQNSNQMKGIASALKSLPKRQVVKNFCDFYRIPEEYRPSWTAFDGPSQGPSKGLPYPCPRALEDTETLNRKPETGELNKNILSGKPDDIRTERDPVLGNPLAPKREDRQIVQGDPEGHAGAHPGEVAGRVPAGGFQEGRRRPGRAMEGRPEVGGVPPPVDAVRSEVRGVSERGGSRWTTI